MKYNQPFGEADPDAPYVDRNTPGAVAGSKVPGAALEDPQREIAHVIDYFLGDGTFGSAQDPADLEQLRKAIQLGVSGRADIPVNGWQSAPPASPDDGDRFVVLPTGTGGFATHDGEIAVWTGAAWVFANPVTGLVANYWTGTRMVMLRFDGAEWAEFLTSTVNVGAVTSYKVPGIYTYTVPDDIYRIECLVWGGGGGGGYSFDSSGGYGGGGGGYSQGTFDVVPGQEIAVTVGEGGVSGTVSVSAGTGGASSVGVLLSATGGGGGSFGNANTWPNGLSAGGVGVGGQFNYEGRGGGVVFNIGGANNIGGWGAPAFNGSWAGFNAADNGVLPGCGAGGGTGPGGNGGIGAAGLVIIRTL